MNLEFLNGNSLQKSACQTAAHNLLNLPFSAIPFTHQVEFTPDPLPSTHNEFAATTWTYGSTEALTKIASIAPAWPKPWDGVKFLQETYAHELGHALYSALSKERRIRIAKMFGAKSDDIDELNPEGSAWEDRISEGIAETFKDAFLPLRYRRYSNRTNHHISIQLYPEFRSIFRDGMVNIGHEFIGPDGVDANRQGGPDDEGIFTAEEMYLEGALTTYVSTGGPYAQLAEPGDPISAAIDRLETGDLLSYYEYRLTFSAGWAETFLSTPVTEITLPKNTEAGWISQSFGITKVTSKGGGLFVFSEPAWVYSGKAAFLLAQFEFQKGFGGSYPGEINEDWATVTPSLFVEGTPPYMSLVTEMPTFPSESADSYLFSSIELPISTTVGVLSLTPQIFAQASGGPSEAAMIKAVEELFLGAGGEIEVPAGRTQPIGYNGGTRRSTNKVIGARL